MKIFISIILALFLNPAAADSSFLYGKSGGYEKSAGYERSAGYGKSRGYDKSGGYKIFDKESEDAKKAYQSRKKEDSKHTKRKKIKRYQKQITKTEQRRKRWIRERIRRDPMRQYIYSTTIDQGGVDDLRGQY